MNPNSTPASSTAFPVGFSILRTGQGSMAQACLVTPYGGRIDKVNLVDDKLTLRVANEDVVLTPIPQDIRDLIRDLKNRDIGVLITDHNVRETLDIVDRACIIYGGQVLFAGSPQDLVADENVRRLYLGESFEL